MPDRTFSAFSDQKVIESSRVGISGYGADRVVGHFYASGDDVAGGIMFSGCLSVRTTYVYANILCFLSNCLSD